MGHTKKIIAFIIALAIYANATPPPTQTVLTGNNRKIFFVGTTNHARVFNGTSDFLVMASNSSTFINPLPSSNITESFWLKWTTFSNNNAAAAEWSSNSDTTNGAFAIVPNSTTGIFLYDMHTAGITPYTICTFARPTAGVWHHYTLVIQASPICVAYIDGISVTTTVVASGAGAALAIAQLYIMSRAGSSQFGTGSMSQFAIYDGAVNSTEAAAMAACTLAPPGVSSATLLYYWPFNQTSPEAQTAGSQGPISLTVNGTTNTTSPCTF